MEKHRIVIAFDLERSGGRKTDKTIAIGAVVMDDDFKELDRLFLPGYIPGAITFEKLCWDEFWSKHTDKLDQIKYSGPLVFDMRQSQMIMEFQAFRAKWERYAKEHGYSVELVSDNPIFDGGFINEMIFEYLPNTLPIPYSTHGEYSSFWDVHSEQRGLLMAIAPEFQRNKGLSKKIQELFDIPEMECEHDHRPDNDAYTIAFEQQVLFAIRDGRIVRKKVTM